jgi:hypothetical protein
LEPQKRGWPGRRRNEVTPFFERLCPAMTRLKSVFTLILRSAPWRASRRMKATPVASWFETPCGLLTMRG